MKLALKLFGKKSRPNIRDLIFCRVPIELWPDDSIPAGDEPWISFVHARELFIADQFQPAVQMLQSILAQPNLESRHVLQTWHFLREAAVQPEEAVAQLMCGVVLEAPQAQGLDIVAGYADHSARYCDHGGATAVLNAADRALTQELDEVLRTGNAAVGQIGPWQAPSLPPPPPGQARVTILTPGGPHFGQAPLDDLAADDIFGPVVDAATRLMKSMIAKCAKE